MENRRHNLPLEISLLFAACALFFAGCATMRPNGTVAGDESLSYSEQEAGVLAGGPGEFVSLNPAEQKESNRVKSSFVDKDGVFWMLFNEKLYKLSGGKLRVCAFNTLGGDNTEKLEAQVSGISLSYNKEVLAQVRKDSETCLIVKHTGDGWRKIQDIQRTYGDRFCYEDSSGRLIIIDAEGFLSVNGEKAGRIISNEADKGTLGRTFISPWFLNAEEDDKGRLWIWTRWHPDYTRFNSCIICYSSGKINFINMEDILGKDNIPSCIAFLGGDKIIISSFNYLLPAKHYRITDENGEIDLRGVAADPLLKYKLNIYSCFAEAPGKTWLIARQERMPVGLWLFDGSDLKKIKDGIFNEFVIGSFYDQNNLFLKESGGNVWVAAKINGALLVTGKGAAEAINWTKGLSLRNVTGIHRDGEGNIIFVNNRDTSKGESDLVQMLPAGSLEKLLAKKAEEKYKLFISREDVMFSSAGVAWWVKAGDAGLDLVKYENGAETKVLGLEEYRQKYKEKYAPSGSYRLLYSGIDSADRIWLYYSETVLIYDPKTGGFSDFSLEDAYLDALNKKISVKISDPKHRVYFTPDGKVMYTGEEKSVARENRLICSFRFIGWYNGVEWKYALPVKGTKKNEQFTGNFFLNKDGLLSMNTVFDDTLPASSFSFRDGDWRRNADYEADPAEEATDKLIEEMGKKTGIDNILKACRIDADATALDTAGYGVIFYAGGKTLKLKGFPKSPSNNRDQNFRTAMDNKSNIWLGRKSSIENEWVMFPRDTIEKEGEVFTPGAQEQEGKTRAIAGSLNSSVISESQAAKTAEGTSGSVVPAPKNAKVYRGVKFAKRATSQGVEPAGTLEAAETGNRGFEPIQSGTKTSGGAAEAENGKEKTAPKVKIFRGVKYDESVTTEPAGTLEAAETGNRGFETVPSKAEITAGAGVTAKGTEKSPDVPQGENKQGREGEILSSEHCFDLLSSEDVLKQKKGEKYFLLLGLKGAEYLQE